MRCCGDHPERLRIVQGHAVASAARDESNRFKTPGCPVGAVQGWNRRRTRSASVPAGMQSSGTPESERKHHPRTTGLGSRRPNRLAGRHPGPSAHRVEVRCRDDTHPPCADPTFVAAALPSALGVDFRVVGRHLGRSGGRSARMVRDDGTGEAPHRSTRWQPRARRRIAGLRSEAERWDQPAADRVRDRCNDVRPQAAGPASSRCRG